MRRVAALGSSLSAALALFRLCHARPVILTASFDVKVSEPFTITWTNATGPVEIQLLESTGRVNGFLKARVSGADSYVWTPPAVLPSGDYTIELTDDTGEPAYGPVFNFVSPKTSTAGSSAISTTSSSTAPNTIDSKASPTGDFPSSTTSSNPSTASGSYPSSTSGTNATSGAISGDAHTRVSLPKGTIAGIVLGVVISTALAMSLLFFLCRRHRKKALGGDEPTASEPDAPSVPQLHGNPVSELAYTPSGIHLDSKEIMISELSSVPSRESSPDKEMCLEQASSPPPGISVETKEVRSEFSTETEEVHEMDATSPVHGPVHENPPMGLTVEAGSGSPVSSTSTPMPPSSGVSSQPIGPSSELPSPCSPTPLFDRVAIEAALSPMEDTAKSKAEDAEQLNQLLLRQSQLRKERDILLRLQGIKDEEEEIKRQIESLKRHGNDNQGLPEP